MDSPQADLWQVTFANKAKDHVLHNNDPEKRPYKVLSFFVPHIQALADAEIPEKVIMWTLTQPDQSRWRTPGEKMKSVGRKMTGYDMDPERVAIDIFTASIIGLTEGFKPHMYNLVWNAADGLIHKVVVWFYADQLHPLLKRIVSAKSARRATIRKYIAEKTELDAELKACEWFVRKCVKERQRALTGTTVRYNEKKALEYIKRHKGDEPPPPAPTPVLEDHSPTTDQEQEQEQSVPVQEPSTPECVPTIVELD